MTPTAEQIRALRDYHGLDRREMAGWLGCSPGAVKEWESGRNAPGPRFAAKLAEMIGRMPKRAA